MVPTHSGSLSHARDARHCCGRSKRNIYHRRSSQKARPRQRLMRARQLSFRLASRARATFRIPPFHTSVGYPLSLTGGPGPPLPWTGRLTLGAGVAWVPATVPGRVSWDRLYNGAYRLPRLLSRIRLLPPNLLAPLPLSFPCTLSPHADCSSLPQRDGIPCSSPPLPD